MKKTILAVVLLATGLALVQAQNTAQTVYVTLGRDDSGRYYAEDYGVDLSRAGRAFNGTEKQYTPGMKVYPNAPNNKYRFYFYGRDEQMKKDTVMDFRIWKSDRISEWYLRVDLIPGPSGTGDDFEEFTATEFQQLIDRFPVFIDQQYM